MMFVLNFFTLLLCSFLVWAEEPSVSALPPPKPKPEIQVYTPQSAEQVENLNKAAEILRDPSKALPSIEMGKTADKALSILPDKKEQPLKDPTQMSSNFRQALKNASMGKGATPASGSSQQPIKTPVIELAAKIMGKNKSVMLKINERVVQVAENASMSIVDKDSQQVITVRVDRIDKNQVKIFVEPLDQTLILQ